MQPRALGLLLTLLLARAGFAAALPLFTLGTPDGSCAEFGLVDQTWPAYAQVFPKPVVFEVGRSPLTDWPYIHPSHHDTWAGGKAHTFTIHFAPAAAPAGPLWLHLGVLAIWEPSQLTITLNGKKLADQRLPDFATGTALAFDPSLPADVHPLSFAVPPGSVTAGANSLEITLADGSWIIYDYVQLSAEATPPAPPAADVHMVDDMLAGPMASVQDVVFALRKPVGEHWYANFAYYAPDASRKLYIPGGKLCRANLRTKAVTTLIDDPQGNLRDPQISYDGQSILFSWRRGTDPHYHLFICGIDGSNPRQITSGDWDDLEPVWLPDGGIAFISSRCKRWVNCWLTQVATLHRCEADGSHVRALSSNNEHDNTPWPLRDGRLLYTRWEYVDRSQVHYHHLWAARPDGTEQTAWYGNELPGTVFIDAKPIPGSDKVVASFSPGHGKTEHEGQIGIIDPKAGPDSRKHARALTRSDTYRDPWPFADDCIMAAQGASLILCDARGRTQELLRLPEADVKAGYWLHEPRPLVSRMREPVVADRTNLEATTGRFALANVHLGRNMTGVKPGEIKKLLVLESLPKPINFTGGMEPLSYGGTFTLERVLGTVPVEPDGSAYFEAPALRSLVFVALDEHDLAVKRMQSFATVQPGETQGCVGCHEQRTQTPPPRGHGLSAAMRRPASAIEPLTGVPDVLDFPRDVQPVLDRRCVSCHNPDQRAGGVDLCGDHGPMYSISYFALTARSQVADGRNRPVSNYAPRQLGSSASPLLAKLSPAHHNVAATDDERRLVRLWIEVGAPYPGTYAALGTGSLGNYEANNLDRGDTDWPATKAGMAVLQRKCAGCHTGDKTLPQSASDNLARNPWEEMAPNDPRRRWASHLLYDLTRPEKSALLLGPLAQAAGGRAACGQAVFADTKDADYQAVLAMIVAAKSRLDTVKRFDMPGFVPRDAWVREMKRYGILPGDADATKLDPYAVERRYWESLWWRPPA